MKALMPNFPRQIAMPYRINCETKEKFFELLNKNNGLKNIFFSIYETDSQGSFQNTIIDKIFFDFDEADALEDVKKLHTWCLMNDIKHCFLYSGKKGFHFYIFCKRQELSFPKDALWNVHEHFIGHLDLKMDPHVKGDIARVSRVPNTWHLSGKRFCTSLSQSDIENGMNTIREKAKKQNILFNIYGEKLLDLKKFDIKNSKNFSDLEVPEFNEEIIFDDKMVDQFPVFIKAWLNDSLHPETGERMGNYEARYYFAVYCKAIGLPRNLCDQIARKYFSKAKRTDMYKNNYNHFVKHNVIAYAYKDDVFFPNYQTLLEKGLFVGKKPDQDNFGLYEQ